MPPREQLALDVRTERERSRDDAYAALSEAFDEVRELVEAIGAAVDYGDEEQVATAVAAAAEWWRAQ